MAIIDLNLSVFGQTVKLVKTGKTLLMSGEIDLTNLDGVGTDISAVIVKHKKKDSSEKGGRVETFPGSIKTKTDVNIEEDDLIITQNEVFLIGEVSLRNDNITGLAGVLSGYNYATLELYDTL